MGSDYLLSQFWLSSASSSSQIPWNCPALRNLQPNLHSWRRMPYVIEFTCRQCICVVQSSRLTEPNAPTLGWKSESSSGSCLVAARFIFNLPWMLSWQRSLSVCAGAQFAFFFWLQFATNMNCGLIGTLPTLVLTVLLSPWFPSYLDCHLQPNPLSLVLILFQDSSKW